MRHHTLTQANTKQQVFSIYIKLFVTKLNFSQKTSLVEDIESDRVEHVLDDDSKDRVGTTLLLGVT